LPSKRVTMTRLYELRMIARVAQMYHEEDQKQTQIASHLGISQASISRMLKKAEREKIVSTKVTSPAGTYAQIEAKLRCRFNLTEAIVVDSPCADSLAIKQQIGAAAAHLVETTMQPDEVIGLMDGSDVLPDMVALMRPIKNRRAKAILKLGDRGNSGDGLEQPCQMSVRLAALTGVSASASDRTQEDTPVSIQERLVQDTAPCRVTLGIIDIGSISDTGTGISAGSGISNQIRIPRQTTPPPTIPEQAFGMSLQEWGDIDRVLAVIDPQTEISRARAVLDMGFVNLLVIDHSTATGLLQG
jgi:DNA-binding transcriptional regulator LsrR (DeoR family)